MDTVDGLKTWLLAQTGVTITNDLSPNTIEFDIDHVNGPNHKVFMTEIYKYKLWLSSIAASNVGTKNYIVSNVKP